MGAMRSIYVQEGRNLRCPALGFDLRLPPEWEPAFASVSRGAAHFTIALNGAHPQFSLSAYPEDHPSQSKFLQEDVRLKSYPKRFQYPFGELFNGPNWEPFLFIKNRIIFTVRLGGRSPDIWEAAHATLQRMSFYAAKVDRLHPSLKDFRYLHPGVPLGEDAAPPGLAEAELRARLRSVEEDRARYASRDDLRSRQIRASTPTTIALVRAALGEYAEAKAAFAESARLLDELFPQLPEDHQLYASALEAALLAGDPELAKRVAERRSLLRGTSKAVADRGVYERALPLLTLGLDGEARTVLAISPNPTWRPGLMELMRALLERDVDALNRSLEETLAAFHRSANRKGSQIWNSVLSYVCAPALVMSVIARVRGLALTEPPSRRATLKNLLAVYVTEFEGRALEKGATFDLAVDYLPEALRA